jgi:hypothetical protein
MSAACILLCVFELSEVEMCVSKSRICMSFWKNIRMNKWCSRIELTACYP